MNELQYTNDCQGCVADRLTEADRAHLAANGWTSPPHTYRMPAEMPPRLPAPNKEAGRSASSSRPSVHRAAEWGHQDIELAAHEILQYLDDSRR